MAPYLRRGTLSLAARVVLRPQKQHVSLVGSTNRSFVSSTQSSSNLLRTSLVRPNFSSRTDNGGEQSYFALQAQFGRRAYSVGKETEQHAFWEHLSYWGDASKEDFLKHQWQTKKSIDKSNLEDFLKSVLPAELPQTQPANSKLAHITTSENFIEDVMNGIAAAPMAIRLAPYILSLVNWANPIEDPTRRQFIPLKSAMEADHPSLTLDSLKERDDSPVPGLVHRYPDKVLLLVTQTCPVYCRFCTRSYAVGPDTESNSKDFPKKMRERLEKSCEYLASHTGIEDVVVSGGDCYSLSGMQLFDIGKRLLSIPNIKRIRYASKGMAVNPVRILDPKDEWTNALIDISHHARSLGKSAVLHTHFNHPNEITWITELAAQRLYQEGVTVRNQTVLLRGVNDDEHIMRRLIRGLAHINVVPYYVYLSDMVSGIEDLRTPLSTILHLEKHIRGTIAGFMTPSFIVDLPGGGGKRLANSYDSYDRESGKSTWTAPGVAGDKVFYYYDPQRTPMQ